MLVFYRTSKLVNFQTNKGRELTLLARAIWHDSVHSESHVTHKRMKDRARWDWANRYLPVFLVPNFNGLGVQQASHNAWRCFVPSRVKINPLI